MMRPDCQTWTAHGERVHCTTRRHPASGSTGLVFARCRRVLIQPMKRARRTIRGLTSVGSSGETLYRFLNFSERYFWVLSEIGPREYSDVAIASFIDHSFEN